MTKPFIEAFEAWKNDNRYQIGDDIGWEQVSDKETDPTSADSSSTQSDNEPKDPA